MSNTKSKRDDWLEASAPKDYLANGVSATDDGVVVANFVHKGEPRGFKFSVDKIALGYMPPSDRKAARDAWKERFDLQETYKKGHEAGAVDGIVDHISTVHRGRHIPASIVHSVARKNPEIFDTPKPDFNG